MKRVKRKIRRLGSNMGEDQHFQEDQAKCLEMNIVS